MRTIQLIIVVCAASFVAAGCGGGSDSSVTGSERIAACLEQQPDATKTQCEGWEKDGKLEDDGTHKNHDSMKME
jgi:hypothetical protein